jgi:hypothetical protein
MLNAIKAEKADFVPNYKIKCEICDCLPTVNVKEFETGEVSKLNLCGVCVWGEAALIDPYKW